MKGKTVISTINELKGYTLLALDGEIGKAREFYFDDQHWTIRYLIIDTRNWLPGKHVLVSPQWIDRVSWSDSTVYVNLTQETIEQSPEYTEESLLTREYETRLHEHYNREGYWVDEPEAKEGAL